MTLEQRLLIDAALRRYGAGLTEDDFVTKNQKKLSVSFDVAKGRLRALGPGKAILATYPASKIEKGVADFVEKFWFWKPA
jgi:hypothetical protein